MVTLLPSQVIKPISVFGAEIATSLTIGAPASVVEGGSFNVSGILIRNDTGGPVSNASVALSYDGVSLGSVTTGIDGDYLKTVSIPTSGNFDLKARFAGGGGLSGSTANTLIVLGEPVSPWVLLVGGLAVVGTLYYLLRRR